ncbi:hypothetical protein [uncultured Clostridium sp.]|uniref:hypothetical protein n=1 Tax=uncultured Clostridium sp. TaxID=59620 RepID=UPI0025FEA86B|nr:hypothetical protein [uncultured Clostridium sp.]
MYTSKLSDMTKGWFVGNFSPTIYSTNDVEVAVKSYKAGECEQAHYHKVATEITVIVSGRVRMNGIEYKEGDIIIMEPNDVTDFYAITDSVNTVVKIPGANNDKYVAEE